MALELISPVLCQHWRTPEHCEDCRVDQAGAMGLRVAAPVTTAAQPEPEIAGHDLFVVHGIEDRSTLIVKGDPIPHNLAHLPRVPVHQAPLTAKQRR